VPSSSTTLRKLCVFPSSPSTPASSRSVHLPTHPSIKVKLTEGALRIQSSLDKAKAWVKELQRQANENIIIALAGNKLDLVTEQPDKRAISTADAEAYAKEADLLFFETSAKTAENVRELFTAIAKKLPLDQVGPRHARPGQRPGVSLAPEGANTQSGGQCAC
jgi:Ras-related protein Rab-5C